MDNWEEYNDAFYARWKGTVLNRLQDIISHLCIIDEGEDEDYWGDLFNEELIKRGYYNA